ncbi:hypothetical protein YPPY10_2286, partial [Yersinia pestis PY-10]
MICQWLG